MFAQVTFIGMIGMGATNSIRSKEFQPDVCRDDMFSKIYPCVSCVKPNQFGGSRREARHLCLALPIFTQVMVQTIAT